jgi:hypothetical protein
LEKIFEIASNVSTPLGLGGLFAAILFWIFKQILSKNIFPSLSANHSADIIKLIIERLFVLALIAMILGFVAFLVTKITQPPPSPLMPAISDGFPRRFEDVRSAELLVSEVDDYLYITINGEKLPVIEFGQVTAPISIIRLLRRGVNVLTFQVDNSQYGGCGSKVELWLNGKSDSDYKWKWFKDIDKAPANGNCFLVNETLYLTKVQYLEKYYNIS